VKIHIHVVFTLQCSRDFALLQLENLHNFWNLATTRIWSPDLPTRNESHINYMIITLYSWFIKWCYVNCQGYTVLQDTQHCEWCTGK